jgi:hypothetical protein
LRIELEKSIFKSQYKIVNFIGGVAQLGERLPCTQEVIGSNPFTSTKINSVDYGRVVGLTKRVPRFLNNPAGGGINLQHWKAQS